LPYPLIQPAVITFPPSAALIGVPTGPEISIPL